VHLSTFLDNDQLDAHLLYFTTRSLSTCAPDWHWLRGRYQMLHQHNSASWWWAYNARNM